MFEWLVIPFQCKMDNAFKHIRKFCAVYIDDVLVFSQSEEEHMSHLEQVTDVFKREGMILSEKKIEWYRKSFNFLGMEIEQGKFKLQNHIVEKIIQFSDELENRKQVQRFCGIVNYARKFVKNLSQDLNRISKKTSSKEGWIWEDEDSRAIQRIKEKMKGLP